jgi:hypothetical protein
MTNWDYYESITRFQRVLKASGAGEVSSLIREEAREPGKDLWRGGLRCSRSLILAFLLLNSGQVYWEGCLHFTASLTTLVLLPESGRTGFESPENAGGALNALFSFF